MAKAFCWDQDRNPLPTPPAGEALGGFRQGRIALLGGADQMPGICRLEVAAGSAECP